MERVFILKDFLSLLKHHGFEFIHENQSDNTIIDFKFNNSNISDIQLDVKERKALVTKLNGESMTYFFVYHGDLMKWVLKYNLKR